MHAFVHLIQSEHCLKILIYNNDILKKIHNKLKYVHILGEMYKSNLHIHTLYKSMNVLVSLNPMKTLKQNIKELQSVKTSLYKWPLPFRGRPPHPPRRLVLRHGPAHLYIYIYIRMYI